MSLITTKKASPINTQQKMSRASRDAGAYRGASYEFWNGPQVYSDNQEANERIIMQRRAADLAANDWVAHAAIDTISSNAVGTGLKPNSNIPTKMLGISESEAQAIGEQMEWAFHLWSEEADLRGMLHFYDLQLFGLQQILSLGEMIHIPVMLSKAEQTKYNLNFSMHLQAISPSRLLTPSDLLTDSSVIDGVRISEFGRPELYYILNPKSNYKENSAMLNSHYSYNLADYTEIRSQIAHRKGIFHLFRHETDEQYRGVSAFSKGMGLMRNLDEVIAYELISQKMAAAFPVFVSLKDNSSFPIEVQNQMGMNNGERERSYFQEVQEGSILYGEEGEEPHILESKRPSANFSAFVDIVTRSISASLGIPFESLTKDFSKTNYSSARAALNEAWKVYNYYRKWFSRLYCQPVWEMVIEESYLRGMIKLPKSAPNFYEQRKLWCNADWIGPSRGHIDPVKEINATILKLDNNLMTYREAWAELGGDFEDSYGQMRTEKEKIKALREIASFNQSLKEDLKG